MYTHICSQRHTHIRLQRHTFMFKKTYIRICSDMYTHLCAQRCTHVFVLRHTPVCSQRSSHVYAKRHIHICTQRCMQKCVRKDARTNTSIDTHTFLPVGVMVIVARKWTRRHEFKSWTWLIAFHIALIPLGKVWIQLFSLHSTNTLGKGMNPIILPPAMGK